MKENRRRFLRNISLGAAGATAGLPLFANKITEGDGLNGSVNPKISRRLPNDFNMCGYAAPKINTVRIGIIGLGMRGPDAVKRMSFIDGVQIVALCDKFPDRVVSAQQILVTAGLPKAAEYSGEEGWKALAERPDIDLVYTCTPWRLHTPIALYAMKNGKHAATEVPTCVTMEECWAIVEMSEKTRKHCVMLENCCYDFFELLTLNMARNGVFGELVHAEGAYLHNLLDLNFSKTGYADMWRLRENASRNGNLYPTHGLGPIAQCLDINRGDKMDYLVSMSSNDFLMGDTARQKAATDPFFQEFANKNYRGNMNTTVIKTNKGKTIMVQHDVTSPRPYSRIHQLIGTKGIACKWPEPPRIALGNAEKWMDETQMKELEEKYTLPIVKHVGRFAKKVGGHGGMDFIMDWRLIDCLRNGLPLDHDVYDAALWSSIAPLSEKSVASRSQSLDVPDFTRGAWKSNKPMVLDLQGAATTTLRNMTE
jgi:Glycosyl hydrolase 109, C-terminal domain/Oxidoreductase family, NAD-binding Rossmann fold